MSKGLDKLARYDDLDDYVISGMSALVLFYNYKGMFPTYDLLHCVTRNGRQPFGKQLTNVQYYKDGMSGQVKDVLVSIRYVKRLPQSVNKYGYRVIHPRALYMELVKDFSMCPDIEHEVRYRYVQNALGGNLRTLDLLRGLPYIWIGIRRARKGWDIRSS